MAACMHCLSDGKACMSQSATGVYALVGWPEEFCVALMIMTLHACNKVVASMLAIWTQRHTCRDLTTGITGSL